MAEVFSNCNLASNALTATVKAKTVGQSFCFKCKSKTSKFECIDCVSSISDRVFCNDCSEAHSKITEFSGHIMLPLQRHVGYRNKRCEHGREQRDCVSCGGSRVCQHQRLQRSCRQCGGNSISF